MRIFSLKSLGILTGGTLLYLLAVVLIGGYVLNYQAGWLKETVDILWVTTQSAAVLFGGYWAMKTFGWEKRFEGASVVKQAMKDYEKTYEEVFSSYVHQGDEFGPPIDFDEDVLPALWQAKRKFFQVIDTCIIPKQLRTKITRIIEDSFQREFNDLASKQSTLRQNLNEIINELDQILPS